MGAAPFPPEPRGPVPLRCRTCCAELCAGFVVRPGHGEGKAVGSELHSSYFEPSPPAPLPLSHLGP